MSRPVVGVFVHEATRSGSVRALISVLDVALSAGLADFAVHAQSSGALMDELAVRSTAPPASRPTAFVVNSTVSLMGALPTLLSGPNSGVPVACLVHEDEEALQTLAPEAIDTLVNRCEQLWCVSDDVAAQIVRLGADASKVLIIPPIIEQSDPGREAEVGSSEAPEIERSNGASVVVGCGTAGWLKGPDLFIDVARRVRDLRSDVHFVWVGPRPRQWARVLSYDVRQLGLEGVVEWVGEVANPRRYFAEADVVLSTSRREAWPLVPMEAGLSGTPTVGFAVGGLAGLARHGLIEAAPYPDTVALADSVLALLSDKSRGESLVNSVRNYVEVNQSVTTVAPMIVEALGRLISGAIRG